MRVRSGDLLCTIHPPNQAIPDARASCFRTVQYNVVAKCVSFVSYYYNIIMRGQNCLVLG
jgi:hypothetical protein